MLGNHENIVIPQESLIFKMFWSFKSHYGDLSNKTSQLELLKDILSTRVIGYWEPKAEFHKASSLLEKPGFGGVVEAIILSTVDGKDIALWGEKSPGHAFYWEAIKSCFPNAIVVHIVRDGRDVATSLIKARMGPKTYYACAKLWQSYLKEIKKVEKSCDPKNFIEIKYEDLLKNTEGVLTRICETLQIRYSDRMLQFFENSSAYKTDAVNARNLHSPLIINNAQKWRKAMSKNQILEFEAIADKELLTKGYEPAAENDCYSKAQLALSSLVYSPIARFKSRAKDVQGQKEFLNLNLIKLRRVLHNYFRRANSFNRN